MPAAKGKKVGQKKETLEEVTVQDNMENDDVSLEEAPMAKAKGRAVTKKGKAADSKKDEDVGDDVEEMETANDDKDDDDDMTVGKSGPKSRGKGVAKKVAGKESDDAEGPNKKASKRGGATKDSNDVTEEDQTGQTIKPKKVAKKEETLPSRRGGDRAAKKVVAYEVEEKAPAKKGRGGKAKNGVSTAPKEDTKKRGRTGKKDKGDMETDDAIETTDDAVKPATVAVEHCKS